MKRLVFRDDTGHVVWSCPDDTSAWCVTSVTWRIPGCRKCDGCTAVFCRIAGLKESTDEEFLKNDS